MTDVPVKPISEIEVKAEVSENDKILILDSETDEARLACKDEIKGDKGDQGDPGAAATVSVGTTCTLTPGSSACVTNSGTSSAAVLNFCIPKGEKGDQGNPGTSATVCVGSTTTLDAGCCATVSNSGTTSAAVFNFGIPKGAKGDPGTNGCNGADGASICAADFNGNNIDFTDTKGCVTTLTDAKTCLKGDKGDTGNTGAAATISVGTTTSLEAGCSATVTNSGTTSAAVFNFGIPKGDKGDTGPTGCTGPTGNGISCVTTSKSGKTTTVTMEYTCGGDPTVFCVQDGADGAGSGDMCSNTYDPTSKMADAFDYCNFYNTPTIPTDNCQLANSCGFTTCTGTLVAADLTPYAKTCTLSTVATSGKYCDLTGQPTIPTNNNQLTNGCGYTTCTGTLVASDLTPYAKSCTLCTVATSGKYCDLTGTPTLCTVATSGKYCDLTGQPTIPTDNCQLANSCGYTTCTGTLVSGDNITCLNNNAGYTTCTGTLTAETIVSGDAGCTYTIKVSGSAPGAGTPATTITFVTA